MTGALPCSRCGRPHDGVRTIIAGKIVCGDCTYVAEYGRPPRHESEPAYGDLHPASPVRQLPIDDGHDT